MRELIGRDTIVEMVHDVTGEVLSTMLNLDAAQDAVYGEMQHGKSDGVVSFVGLAGPELAGTGSLHCSSRSACHLAARLLMSDFDSVNDEVLDAIGELTNMIVGSFKNEIEQHIGPTGLSIPTVIYGRNFSTRSLGREDWMVVPFSCGEEHLEVKVCLKGREEPCAHIRHGEKHEFILSH